MASEKFGTGQFAIAEIEQQMLETLISGGANRVDYARIVDRETLESPARTQDPAVAIIAAHVGTTRLIDNMLLEPRRA